MSSEKQKRAGYILPAQLTGHELVCLTLQIPNVPEYRAAVRGALNELGKWWAWEKGGYGDTRATQAATYWRTLLEETLQIGECGSTMFDVRQNEELPCTLEKTADGETWVPWADLQKCPPKIKALAGRLFYSTNGGSTWDPIQDDTYTEYDWRQDEPLKPIRAGDNKRCLAAANAVAVFVELQREMVAWYDSQGTLLQIGMAVSVAIALMFPGGWPVVAGGLLTGAGAAVLQWSQALTNTAFTPTIQDQLRCIFWTWADENGRWDQGNFSLVLSDVQSKTGDMWRLLEIYLREIGGYVGLNNAGTTTSVATAGCQDCEESWCYTFDFTASSHGWTAILEGQNQRGEYVAGSGWRRKTGAIYQGLVQLNSPTFSSSYVTWVSMELSMPMNGPTKSYQVRENAYGGSGHDIPMEGVSQATYINANVTGLGIGAASDNRDEGEIEFPGFIQRITLSGTGINPFGEDNCT